MSSSYEWNNQQRYIPQSQYSESYQYQQDSVSAYAPAAAFPSSTATAAPAPPSSYDPAFPSAPQIARNDSSYSSGSDSTYALYPSASATQNPSPNGFDNTGYLDSRQPSNSYVQPQRSYSDSSNPSYHSQPSVYHTPALTASPDHITQAFPTQIQAQVQPKGSYYKSPAEKHRRSPDHDEEDVDQDALESKEKVKPGACARCKNLKVRCEFKTDTDPCKRCLNGGHECVTPGRKKRRTPPKREHLLNQIREQADQIQSLMTKLEEVQKEPAVKRSSSPSSNESPVLSPPSSTRASSYFASEEANKVVENWLTRARESLAEFGGFIGAGLPKRYIVEQDPEDSPSSEEADDNEREYDIAVVKAGPRERERAMSEISSGGSVGPRKKDAGDGEKLASLPSEAVPFGLMAGLSLRKNRKQGSGSEVENAEESGVGVANDDFFRSSPTPDPMRTQITTQTALILAHGVIAPGEAERLFDIFFDKMNLSVSLVDPELYNVQKTLFRSPFLFTVICAIASRFYVAKPELYQLAMQYAQDAAGTALTTGPKNVELVMGYILLSLYPVPSKRWEDERGWIYLGLAIRIAVDLNLHLPHTAKPQNESHAREQLNRTRVWLNCFNLDRSTGSQYGKAPIIDNMDYTANHSENWWRSSDVNMKNFDIHLCCYNAELKTMAKFRAKIYSNPDHPTGLNKEVDLERLAMETDEELLELQRKWFAVLDQTDMNDEQNCFRTGLLRLAFSYARLICLSFGFQHAFGKGGADENPFFLRCLAAATDVLNTVQSDIGRPNQRKYLLHGPQAQSVFTTFAAAFLIKLLQPKYASYLTPEQRIEIRALVQSVIDLLGSPEVAMDDRHGPKLYACFLKGLLSATGGKPRRPKSSSSRSASAYSGSPEPSSSLHSFSPQPSQPAASFSGTFAPSSVASPQLNVADYFTPPLPFDTELLQSMQNVTDPSVWQHVALPGYSWMAQFNQEVNQAHIGGAQEMSYSTTYGVTQ